MRLCAIVVAALLSAAALAADNFQVEAVEGKPIRTLFPDGRVAEASVARSPLRLVNFRFQITENDCTGILDTLCSITTSFQLHKIALQWTKHPDATKVGKVVISKFDAKKYTFPMEFRFVLQSVDKVLRPKAAGPVPPDEISCPDYRWLRKGSLKSPPDRTVISRWEGETMLPNPESDVSENRVFGGAMGVELVRNAKNSLEVASTAYLTGFFPSLYFGATIALILTEGGHCQITLKPNPTELIEAFTSTFGATTGPPAPYLMGQDEYSYANSVQMKNLRDLATQAGWVFE